MMMMNWMMMMSDDENRIRAVVTPVYMSHTSSKQAQAAVAPWTLYVLNLWDFSSTHN